MDMAALKLLITLPLYSQRNYRKIQPLKLVTTRKPWLPSLGKLMILSPQTREKKISNSSASVLVTLQFQGNGLAIAQVPPLSSWSSLKTNISSLILETLGLFFVATKQLFLFLAIINLIFQQKNSALKKLGAMSTTKESMEPWDWVDPLVTLSSNISRTGAISSRQWFLSPTSSRWSGGPKTTS